MQEIKAGNMLAFDLLYKKFNKKLYIQILIFLTNLSQL